MQTLHRLQNCLQTYRFQRDRRLSGATVFRIKFPTVLRTALLAILAIGVLPGCSSSSYVRIGKQKMLKATPENPAVHVLAIWEPSEGRGLDGLPTKGFAGQLLFVTRQSNSPVVVDGAVRIYVFDDVGSPEEQGRPIHQFDFSPEAWNVHVQKTTLGPSYHVFIPYTRKDNPFQTKCALRVRLINPSGEPIYSDLIEVTLPGKERSEEQLAKARGRSPGSKESAVADAILAEYERLKQSQEPRPEPKPEVTKRRTLQVATITKDGKTHTVTPNEDALSTVAHSSTVNTTQMPGQMVQTAGGAGNPLNDDAEARIQALEQRIAELLEANGDLAQVRRSHDRQSDAGAVHATHDQLAPLQHQSETTDGDRETSSSSSTGARHRRFRLAPHPLALQASPDAASPAAQPAIPAGDDGRSVNPLSDAVEHPIASDARGGAIDSRDADGQTLGERAAAGDQPGDGRVENASEVEPDQFPPHPLNSF